MSSKERCWNCNSEKYFQSARIEYCPDCEIRCDYHGEGANALYDQAMAEQNARREAEQHREWAEQERKEREADQRRFLRSLGSEIEEDDEY